MEQKKKRGENWSSEEKEILRTLISQSAHIIENKSTKTSVNIQKIKEWKNITNKFNEITGKRRSDGELKLSWKRMKLCAKSNLYTYRREQSKTGGGGKPPSPSLEDLEIMSIAPHDFIVEVNNYDSDAVDPVTVATTSKEVADPKPRLNFEKTDTAIVKNVENPEPNVVYVQEIDPTTDTEESAKMVKITNNKDIITRGITKIKNRKNSLQNRREDVHQTIVKSNTDFKKRQLEMMEEEHKYNIKIANLKIRKLELQIFLLESQKNTS